MSHNDRFITCYQNKSMFSRKWICTYNDEKNSYKQCNTRVFREKTEEEIIKELNQCHIIPRKVEFK